MDKKKKPKDIPGWLRVLPKGEYNLKQLMKISKQCKQSVVRTLSNLKIEKYYVPRGESHVLQVVYVWNGKLPTNP